MPLNLIIRWTFCVCVGYLVSASFYGAVAGLTVGLALTILADIVYSKETI